MTSKWLISKVKKIVFSLNSLEFTFLKMWETLEEFYDSNCTDEITAVNETTTISQFKCNVITREVSPDKCTATYHFGVGDEKSDSKFYVTTTTTIGQKKKLWYQV